MVRPRFAGLLKFNPTIDHIVPVTSYTEAVLLKRLFPGATWNVLYKHRMSCNVFGVGVNNPNSVNLDDRNYYDFGCLADVYSLIGLGEPTAKVPKIFPDPSFDADSFLNKAFPEPARPLLAIHATSDEAARSWDPIKAQAFVDALVRDTEFNIIELGLSPVLTPSERVFQVRGSIPLASQLALVGRANRFVGVDSGFAHIASAAGVDCLFLLGAFHTFKNYLPWQLKPSDRVIRTTGQCRAIEPEEVLAAIVGLPSGSGRLSK
jgi:ADP-heptose:LPS heptosyltransferase